MNESIKFNIPSTAKIYGKPESLEEKKDSDLVTDDKLGISKKEISSKPNEHKVEQIEPWISDPKIILPKGTKLNNRYTIKSLLTEGGMGRIYLCDDEQFKTPIALKEIPLISENEQEKKNYLTSLEEEAQILRRLSNESIPQVFGSFSEYERYFIAMEYVEGKNIRESFEDIKNKISDEDILDLASKICDSLIYLHGQEPNAVIHADIKPENIIIDKLGKLKLVDFGISSILQKNLSNSTTKATKKAEVYFTPFYSASEIMRSKKPNVESDIFSLGAILLWMRTGDDSDIFDSLKKLNEMHKKSEVSDKLYDIIIKACEMSPHNRYHSANELKLAIEEDKESTKTSEKILKESSLNNDLKDSLRNIKKEFDLFTEEYQDTNLFKNLFGSLHEDIRKGNLYESQQDLEAITKYIFSIINWDLEENKNAVYFLKDAYEKLRFLDGKLILRDYLSKTKDQNLKNPILKFAEKYFSVKNGLKEFFVQYPDVKNQLRNIVDDSQEDPKNGNTILKIIHNSKSIEYTDKISWVLEVYQKDNFVDVVLKILDLGQEGKNKTEKEYNAMMSVINKNTSQMLTEVIFKKTMNEKLTDPDDLFAAVNNCVFFSNIIKNIDMDKITLDTLNDSKRNFYKISNSLDTIIDHSKYLKSISYTLSKAFNLIDEAKDKALKGMRRVFEETKPIYLDFLKQYKQKYLDINKIRQNADPSTIASLDDLIKQNEEKELH